MARSRHSERRAKQKPQTAPPQPAAAPRPLPVWLVWAANHGFGLTLLSAVTLCFLHWMSVQFFDPFYGQTAKLSDMRTYWNWAHELAAGDWLSRKTAPGPFYYGPLYAYFLALLFKLFGESYQRVHLVQALLGVLPPVVLWAVARRLFGKGPALATGLLAAACAPFLLYEQQLLMEGLLLAISAVLLGCLVGGQESPRRAWLWALAAGLLSGLCCWGRGNFFFVIPFLAALWLVVPLVLREQSAAPAGDPLPDAPPAAAARKLFSLLRPGAPAALAYVLGVSLILGLTLWRNVHVGGYWTFTTSNGPILLYQGNAHDAPGVFFWPPSAEALKQRYGSQTAVPWTRELLRDVLSHPFSFILLMFNKTWMFWNSYDTADNLSYYLCKRFCFFVRWSPVTWLTLVPLAGLGLWETRRLWRRQLFLYGFAAAYAFSIIVVFIVGRYRLAVLLPLLVWAGAAVAGLLKCLWETRWDHAARRALPVAAGIALLWPTWSTAVNLNAIATWPGRRLIRPNDYNRLGLAYLETRQRQTALRVFEEGAAEYPFVDIIVFPLAKLYMEDGVPQKAAAILQEYVYRKGHNKDGVLLLADALSRSGQKAQALQILQSVLTQNPGDESAKALLMAVQARP